MPELEEIGGGRPELALGRAVELCKPELLVNEPELMLAPVLNLTDPVDDKLTDGTTDRVAF